MSHINWRSSGPTDKIVVTQKLAANTQASAKITAPKDQRYQGANHIVRVYNVPFFPEIGMQRFIGIAIILCASSIAWLRIFSACRTLIGIG